MTVRVAQTIGMTKVVEMAKRLGVVDDLQAVLAMALGAGETTVLRLTNAYAQIDNGGKKVTPTLIDRVQDKLGHSIFRHDERPCDGCADVAWTGQAPPKIPDTREQVLDPADRISDGLDAARRGSARHRRHRRHAGQAARRQDRHDQ